MHAQEFYEVLKQINIGNSFSLDEASQLFKVGHLVDFKENDILMCQDKESLSILVLLHGNAEIIEVSGRGFSKLSRNIGRGDILGTWGAIANIPCRQTIRAKTALTALTISQSALEKLVLDGSSIGSKLCLYLAREMVNHMNVSKQELDRLRSNLLEKTEQLKQNNLKVKKQISHLNSEIKKAKVSRRGMQLMISIGACGLMTLLGTFLLKSYYRPIPELSYNQSHPTIVPYIDNPETCDKRSGSYWIGEQCWDYEHSREF